MTSTVHHRFLEAQYEAARRLDAACDLLDLVPVSGTPPNRYLAHFHCTGLVREAGRPPREADDFTIGINLPPDYLRRVEPLEVIHWLEPRIVFHPNCGHWGPLVVPCVGPIRPGTPIQDLCEHLHGMISWDIVTLREDDALDVDAVQWGRVNQHRLPVDRRPMCWRAPRGEGER